MIQKHIEIVRSSIPSLSSMSQISCDGIVAVLRQHYASVGVSTVNNLVDLEAVVRLKPDLVFLGMKYVQGDSDIIWVTKYLDDNGIAYTGSDHSAHELEFDKSLAKQRALDHGLITSDFYVAFQGQLQPRTAMLLSFPLFVKPTSKGGGLGIDSDSVAYNFDQLESKVQSIATEFQSDSLVEQYLQGREFSVAILKSKHSAVYLTMPLELIAPEDSRGARLLSAVVKSADTESFRGVTDQIIKEKICALAIDVFHALGARDYGRIDIRMDGYGVPHFLEANLLPSLINGYGNFPKACLLNMGLSYEEMVLRIAELGMKRTSTLEHTYEELNQPLLNPFVELLA